MKDNSTLSDSMSNANLNINPQSNGLISSNNPQDLLSSFKSSSNTNLSKVADNMRVAIRIRPPLTREIEKMLPFRSIAITSKENRTCSLVEYIGAELDEGGRQRDWVQSPQMFQLHRFTFDEVFDINSSQEYVYDHTAKSSVRSVLEGYNSTIFAYGQTGTGKTFTMEGFTYDNFDQSRGIIPRTIEDIFAFIESNSNRETKFIIRASYLQIYNEMISDLLKANSTKTLNIREEKKKGIFVENLSEWAVRSPHDIYALLEKGASCRAIANTNMNDVSSRSHAVFMIIVEQMSTSMEEPNGQQVIKVGRLNLVDLAGSERTRVSGATGKQLEETKKINKSLSALGNVINALTDSRGRIHIPYRDSKLTRLLENSLGGNCKTTMIATISPAQCSFMESLSTLNFAKRAKNIRNRPIINEDINHNALIHQYESELKKLRAELELKSQGDITNDLIIKLEAQKKRAEKDKNEAIKALEQASLQFFQERDEKKKLEAKIEMMNLQMITGGGGHNKIEDTPQFKTALEAKQQLLEKDFEQKLQEIERDKEKIEDSKAQVEAYNKLLYKQRDIMNNLTASLHEKDEKIAKLQKSLDESNKILSEQDTVIHCKSIHIEQLETILDHNKLTYVKEINQLPLSIHQLTNKNKIYIPYEAERNGTNFTGKLIPLLSSEEKIKELNDLVSDKEKELTLLKRVSEKIFVNALENDPNQLQNLSMNNRQGIISNMSVDTHLINAMINKIDIDLASRINQIEEKNEILINELNERNQMIQLQRQENESLEEHYSAIEKMYHQTEKENLRLINIKENIISSLDKIIKKIDSVSISTYTENILQSLRTDLVKVFQIVLDNSILINTISTPTGSVDDLEQFQNFRKSSSDIKSRKKTNDGGTEKKNYFSPNTSNTLINNQHNNSHCKPAYNIQYLSNNDFIGTSTINIKNSNVTIKPISKAQENSIKNIKITSLGRKSMNTNLDCNKNK